MDKKILRAAAISLGAAVGSASAHEAEPSQGDTTAVSLANIEIVANRANEKTPVAFTNVSKSELAKANDGRDIPYLLKSTPSVITTSDAGAGMGYTSMRIRGTDASRINITAKGIPRRDKRQRSRSLRSERQHGHRRPGA